MEVTYSEWCEGKLRASAAEDAVPHGALHPRLFPFQKQVTEWALRLGRAAIFAECGLGKTAMQLGWARHVAAHTGRRVLIIAPLAVASQTIREAASMDLPVEYVRTAAEVDAAAARVVITNYERLDAVPVEAFGGVVLDESSILKSLWAARRPSSCGAARACATGSRAPRRPRPTTTSSSATTPSSSGAPIARDDRALVHQRHERSACTASRATRSSRTGTGSRRGAVCIALLRHRARRRRLRAARARPPLSLGRGGHDAGYRRAALPVAGDERVADPQGEAAHGPRASRRGRAPRRRRTRGAVGRGARPTTRPTL